MRLRTGPIPASTARTHPRSATGRGGPRRSSCGSLSSTRVRAASSCGYREDGDAPSGRTPPAAEPGGARGLPARTRVVTLGGMDAARPPGRRTAGPTYAGPTASTMDGCRALSAMCLLAPCFIWPLAVGAGLAGAFLTWAPGLLRTAFKATILDDAAIRLPRVVVSSVMGPPAIWVLRTPRTLPRPLGRQSLSSGEP